MSDDGAERIHAPPWIRRSRPEPRPAMLCCVGASIRFGLRGRMVASFALGALVAAAALGLVTYASTRNYLENQRMDVALRQAFNNAQLVRTVLAADRSNAASLVTNVRSEPGGYAVLHVEDDGSDQSSFFAQEPLRFTQSNLPPDLLTAVIAGRTGTERFDFNGEPYQAVGVAVPSTGIQYFEVFPLAQVDRTMALVGTTLVLGAIGSAVLAGLLGLALSRSVLRPLSRVTAAARRIASGGLDTRLASEDDRELAQLVASFNGMADAVQERIEREQRFSSDVSHELRSPVTALSAAIQSISGRISELPPRTAQAMAIIEQQVVRLDRTVRDLLELSRLDEGAAETVMELIDVRELVSRVMARHGFWDVPLRTMDAPEQLFAAGDRRRIERVLVNLLENARDHGGGATSVMVRRSGSHVEVMVADDGPGIAVSERSAIFQRFARGTASRSGTGSGLGLAIVLEHTRAMGGGVRVEESPDGGARFVVSLPVTDVVHHINDGAPETNQ